MSGASESSVLSEKSGGEKLQAVNNALNSAANKVLAGWKSSLLASCFPSLSKDNEAVIDAMKTSMVTTVQKALLEDFAALIDEDVTKSLNEFSTIVKRCSGPKDTIAWRPPRDPVVNMLAHDAKVLKYEKEHIVDALKRVKASSSKAQKAVDEGYKECQKNHLEIKKNLSIINELQETSEIIKDAFIMDMRQRVLCSPSNFLARCQKSSEDLELAGF